MNTTDPRRQLDRSRAARRLRAMTVGTALAGVVATGTLGWTAAMTYRGSTSASATVALAGAATSTTTSAATAATTSGSTGTTGTTSHSSTTVRSSSGAAHASTGSS